MKKDEQTTQKTSRDRLSEWRKQNPKATLTEIELSVEKELAKLRAEWVTGVVKERPTSEAEPCPNCQRKMVRNGRKKRELQGKDGTVLKIERDQMKCQGCGLIFFPSG